MSGTSPWFGIQSRRGRRVIAIGALFYAAVALGVAGLAIAAGHLPLLTAVFLLGIAASGLMVFWKLRR